MAHQSSASPDLPYLGQRRFFLCKICRQAVRIETCNTDEKGQPVHEQCYLDAVSQDVLER
jgi:hypothetical protein